MHATPIIPGYLYRVRGCGIDLRIPAAHGCDAICNALAQALPCAA